MLSFVVLACLGLAGTALGFGGSHGPSYGSDYVKIDDLYYTLTTLEDDLLATYDDISHLTTECAINDDLIKFIEANAATLPAINSAQSALIDDYRQQLQSLQEQINADIASANTALSRANDTTGDIADLTGQLTGIEEENEELQQRAMNLTDQLNELKDNFTATLNQTVEDLDTALNETEDKIEAFTTFVNNQRCEFGQGAFSPKGYVFIPFKTEFTEIPSVSVTLQGFVAHLDLKSYDKYDGLALDKYVNYVNQTGFSLQAQDVSEGMVGVKTVYCGFMACQGLEGGLVIHPDDATTDGPDRR